MCRPYRATLETQNSINILNSWIKNEVDKRSDVIHKMNINLNESGKLLINTQFLRYLLINTRQLLGHKIKRKNFSCDNDVDYIDDRIIFSFFIKFLDAESAKLFYFRLFKKFIKTEDSFEIWKQKNLSYWAFESPAIFDQKLFQPYFYDNKWISFLN